jgi:pimeloyl-ACP methyl ester carboxylesterase
MSSRPRARTRQPHSAEIRQVYERLLAGAPVRSRHVEMDAGNRVHLLEQGAGPPVVLLHGTGNPAGFLLPLLQELRGVRAIAPDLPGVGLSDPADLPVARYRERAVAWLDRLLDTLELDATTLLGHSGGGVWALWYALAHPDRVRRLVLLGVPTLPGTRCPLPIRVIGTPGLGRLVSRLAPPSPRSVLRLASAVGEKGTLARHPDLVDLLVAAGRDPVTDRAATAELHALISPFALVSPSGFRRRSRVRPDELRRLAMPTLVVWGERDPVGSIPVARAVAELIPDARLEVLPTGHGPWLGQPTRTAATVADFVLPLREAQGGQTQRVQPEGGEIGGTDAERERPPARGTGR